MFTVLTVYPDDKCWNQQSADEYRAIQDSLTVIELTILSI